MKNKNLVWLTLFVVIFGCTPKTTLNLEDSDVEVVEIEERTLDELVVTATRDYKLPTYNPSYTRSNDLIHTKLEVSFDFDKQHVFGKATLELEPYFYPTNKVVLDAKGFDIHEIKLLDGAILNYEYQNDLLTIQLDKEYQPKERYTLFIDYTAKPNERTVGGSAAITQDKGLYFINPKGETPNKPTQIWTQGETESNSAWFPTIDKPNERCTQEISVTIRDDFETLSNGILKSSVSNDDGTRTDYWVMDMPHAPYLFMLAIGDFAVVREEWRGKEVSYYVEKKYEPYAKRIFPYTLEMLDFYSELYGYDYPWQKYAQVVVRDYVSGAMENTTGVIFGEFMNGTERELIDEKNNERIVAHELVHHWFGDLVTCESWANLPLNESFANYGEYLWMEKKHGREEADYHLMNELNGYFSQAQTNTHDLIYFDYRDKEQTFDAHSYNKGGCILHSLRSYLGNKAFFAGLQHYLKSNEFTAVEAHDLRLSFEEVTGQDLNWFFNQWFFATGHPELEVSEEYDSLNQKVIVTITQTQDANLNEPIYQLPIAIDVYENDKPTRHNVFINKRKQVFEFKVSKAPKLVNVDADKILVGTIKHYKSIAQLIFQYQNADNFKSRFEALSALEGLEDDEARAIFEMALNDTHWFLRSKAVQNVEANEKIADLAINDPHSAVRADAMEKLGFSGNKAFVPILKSGIENDLAYPVMASALESLINLDLNSAETYAQKLEKEESVTIWVGVGKTYALLEDVSKLSFFENTWSKINGFQCNDFMKSYDKLLSFADDQTKSEVVDKLKEVSMNAETSLWQRFSSTRSIYTIKKYFEQAVGVLESESNESDEAKLEMFRAYLTKVESDLAEIVEWESNTQLLSIYGTMK